MVKRLLHITDPEDTFAHNKPGNLYVPGGEEAMAAANALFREIPRGHYPFAMLTRDTHNWFSYYSSTECMDGQFPNIHAEFGRPDWSLACDIELLWNDTKVFFM